MKPTFHHRAVNGPFEDPCLYVRIIREKKAFLFDLGDIGRLRPADIQKVTDVFVTHMHIDHFIGFDTLVRMLLRRDTPVRIYGPENITECIEGKMKGYTWNLIKDYPLRVEVFEILPDSVKHSVFYSKNRFIREDGKEKKTAVNIIHEDPMLKVRVVHLTHQVPTLGFSLEEDYHININKDALEKLHLPVGPWLSDFKKAIRENAPDDIVFTLSTGKFSLGELREIATITEGQKISYVMDTSVSESNIRKITEFVRGSDTFYCEAYFCDEDMERALERHHLTAGISGRIAREAGVKAHVVLHFSPKYIDRPELIYEEAIKEFKTANSG